MCTIAAFFLNEMQYLELLNQINSCAAKPENFHSTEVDGPAAAAAAAAAVLNSV